MATVKHGTATPPPEWWRHLRPYNKRRFWKRERKAHRRAVAREVSQCP